jgi:hypothetical protein
MSPDRRVSGRSSFWIEATCHIDGAACRAKLTDVSIDGCRAEVTAAGLTAGNRVVLQLDDLLSLPATVAWVDGAQAGLEFGHPMMGAMLSQFILRYGRDDGLH